jgi:hypothetical protein
MLFSKLLRVAITKTLEAITKGTHEKTPFNVFIFAPYIKTDIFHKVKLINADATKLLKLKTNQNLFFDEIDQTAIGGYSTSDFNYKRVSSEDSYELKPDGELSAGRLIPESKHRLIKRIYVEAFVGFNTGV